MCKVGVHPAAICTYTHLNVAAQPGAVQTTYIRSQRSIVNEKTPEELSTEVLPSQPVRFHFVLFYAVPWHVCTFQLIQLESNLSDQFGITFAGSPRSSPPSCYPSLLIPGFLPFDKQNNHKVINSHLITIQLSKVLIFRTKL